MMVPEHDRLGRRGADIAEHDLERRHRRRKQFVDGADEARKIDAERGVGDALRQQHQHDQARHDEGAVADAVDLGDARADRGAEHDEVERRRDHRRDDALEQGARGPRHLVDINGAYGVDVHGCVPQQADENVLQRALCRVQIPKPDAGGLQRVEQRGDAGALALGVVGVGQLLAVGGEGEMVGVERRRDGVDGLVQLQRQLLAAELAHQFDLVLDQDDLALVDDADPVGHLLGLFDVMGGEDDGDARRAQRPHQLPHVLAQFDVDAGGRLVEKQDLRLVRQRLGDQHPPLHAAGQRHDPGVFLVPQRQLPEHLLDVAGIRRLAEQPAGKAHGRRRRLEGVGGQFLRHQADQAARGAIVGEDVVAVDGDRARGRLHDAADDIDQRRLAGAVRPEQRKDLAVADLQVDVLQGLEARGVGLVEMRNGNGGVSWRCRRHSGRHHRA